MHNISAPIFVLLYNPPKKSEKVKGWKSEKVKGWKGERVKK